MMLLYKILLYLHIASGFTALAAGLVAMLSKKGRKLHVLGGTIYFWGMTGVFATALPMTLLKFNPFLLGIAVFSYYLVLTGLRFNRIKRLLRKGQYPLVDKIIGIVSGISFLGMFVFGLSNTIFGDNSFGIILGVFGFIGIIQTRTEFKLIFNREDFRIKVGKTWTLHHIGRMGGGYIATATAFIVTNVQLEPPILLWLGPTAIGTPIIIYAVNTWKKKMTPKPR
jgi:uncharacterized membrane protein